MREVIRIGLEIIGAMTVAFIFLCILMETMERFK